MSRLSRLVRYKPTDNPNVFNPEYHLDKNGTTDPKEDGVTFSVQVEGEPWNPSKVAYIPSCIFNPSGPCEYKWWLYPGA